MAGGQQAELNRRLIARLDRTRSAAIDGLRHRIDFDSLSIAMTSSFRLIFLEVRPAIRFERLRSRFASEEQFRTADSAPVEAHIEDLKSLATTVISNEGSLESLHQLLDEWIAAGGIGERT
jgi:dephospho-CoA kinase